MTDPEKPLLRGVSHELAFFAALGAGAVLIAMAPTAHAALATSVYVVSLAAMLGISASYHRGPWGPRGRALWQRADHAMIFLFIAGSYTPICLLALGGNDGLQLLGLAWVGASAGVLRAIFWPRAPRVITAGLYVVLGWALVIYWRDVAAALGPVARALFVAGGVLYTAGALVYATRRPDPSPRVFGYHEVFHVLVIAASICHFAAVVALVRQHGG